MKRARNAAECREFISSVCLLANRGPVNSVLICDDRAEARANLSDIVRSIPGVITIGCVNDGFELVDAHISEPADLILVGFHERDGSADQAMSLVLGIDPAAVVVVVGAVGDAELLVEAYIRGARGLLLWDWDSAPED